MSHYDTIIVAKITIKTKTEKLTIEETANIIANKVQDIFDSLSSGGRFDFDKFEKFVLEKIKVIELAKPLSASVVSNSKR